MTAGPVEHAPERAATPAAASQRTVESTAASETAAAVGTSPVVASPVVASPVAARVLGLQRAAGNRAVAARLAPKPPAPRVTAPRPTASRAIAPAAGPAQSSVQASAQSSVVQRDDAPATLADAINGTDPDALKRFRPFPRLSPADLAKICRLVIDKTAFVGPDDATTLESAWRSVDQGALDESHWALWKECASGHFFNADVGLVPWLHELRGGFADKVYDRAGRNVGQTIDSVKEEAKRLGIGVDGEAAAPSQAADEAVAQQRALAAQITDAQNRLKALRQISVGYGPKSWQDGEQRESAPGGIPQEADVPVAFDPDAPPLRVPTPHEDPEGRIAKYDAVKAVHVELTDAVARTLEANPALYAIVARNDGSAASVLGDDTSTEAVRRKLAAALQDVLTNAAATRGEIQDRSLSFAAMLPVHKEVFASEAAYKTGFARRAAQDYIDAEAGAEAAASKAVSLFTIALITGVEVATGGTATPAIGALISLAASSGTAVASWADWSRLETAAKATASDKNAIVTQEQADSAQLSALISTAAALFDVYGAGKALVAASAEARAAVSALEGKVGDFAKLKQVAEGALGPEAKTVLESSVSKLGAAQTVRTVGNWERLTAALADSPALNTVNSWRSGVFTAAEDAAATAAAGAEGDVARAALAVASGIEQAALGEAIDAVIEVVSGDLDGQGQIGVGGQETALSIESMAASVPAQPASGAPLQRSMVEVVDVPVSQLSLGAMRPDEFERIIRPGVASGYFADHGLPRMTVIDGKLNESGHGYDGIGISKQGDQIKLYNLECKYVSRDSDHIPALGETKFGIQGGPGWNEQKVRALLSAENEIGEATRKELTAAIQRRSPGFRITDQVLEDTLAHAFKQAPLTIFVPVWAETEVLLAQLRGLARAGVIGKLIRIVPRGLKG